VKNARNQFAKNAQSHIRKKRFVRIVSQRKRNHGGQKLLAGLLKNILPKVLDNI